MSGLVKYVFAILYNNTQRPVESVSHYSEALQVLFDLSKKNPRAFMPQIAATQEQLGDHYLEMKEFDDAANNYGAAIQTWYDLAESNPKSSAFLAKLLDKRGTVCGFLRSADDSTKDYSKALAKCPGSQL